MRYRIEFMFAVEGEEDTYSSSHPTDGYVRHTCLDDLSHAPLVPTIGDHVDVGAGEIWLVQDRSFAIYPATPDDPDLDGYDGPVTWITLMVG